MTHKTHKLPKTFFITSSVFTIIAILGGAYGCWTFDDMSGLSGVFTVALCILGMTICGYHAWFWRHGRNKFDRAMFYVFISDMCIYGITLAFGIWALMHLEVTFAQVMHWIRHPVMVANITAGGCLGSIYAQARTEIRGRGE